jgi:hypothetical protein
MKDFKTSKALSMNKCSSDARRSLHYFDSVKVGRKSKVRVEVETRTCDLGRIKSSKAPITKTFSCLLWDKIHVHIQLQRHTLDGPPAVINWKYNAVDVLAEI